MKVIIPRIFLTLKIFLESQEKDKILPVKTNGASQIIYTVSILH